MVHWCTLGPCIQIRGAMYPVWKARRPTLGPCIQIRGPLYPAWMAHWRTLGPGIQICRPMYPVWNARWTTLGPCIQIRGPLYALAHKTKVPKAPGLADPPEASRNIRYMYIIYTGITTTPHGFSQWPLVKTDKSESKGLRISLI